MLELTRIASSCFLSVRGTVASEPPLGSTDTVFTVTLGTPPADGQSVNVQFLLGVIKNGPSRIFFNVEALP